MRIFVFMAFKSKTLGVVKETWKWENCTHWDYIKCPYCASSYLHEHTVPMGDDHIVNMTKVLNTTRSVRMLLIPVKQQLGLQSALKCCFRVVSWLCCEHRSPSRSGNKVLKGGKGSKKMNCVAAWRPSIRWIRVVLNYESWVNQQVQE